ncbi:MAG: WecB/TagA/CpsF family glycosyltransferase [Pirellulales bacterium]
MLIADSETVQVDQQSAQFLQRKACDAESALGRLEKQIRLLEHKVEEAFDESHDGAAFTDVDQPWDKPEQVDVWGVPFSRLNLAEVLHQIDHLIRRRQPSYFITANVNYAMLTASHRELHAVNRRAAFVVCDGMPIVWWSKLMGRALPERVAGSELIYAISKWASIKGYRIFFLGGAPGVARAAADKLTQRYPELQVAGVATPPFRPLAPPEEAALVDEIRAARPDILFAALGQPKGEIWVARMANQLGVPVSVQLGASFDFVAGGVPRAPLWLQRLGLEWLFRLAQEPQRLSGRYARNALFLLRAAGHDVSRLLMGC